MTNHIDIVFEEIESDGPPKYSFIEIENDKGQSIRLGEWVEGEDDYMRIRITKSDFEKLFMNKEMLERAFQIDLGGVRERERIIHAIENLYPPDYHSKGEEMILQALKRCWRKMPTFFLEALKTECVNEDRKNARGIS